MQARIRKPAEKFVDLVGVGAVRASVTAKDLRFYTRLQDDFVGELLTTCAQ